MKCGTKSVFGDIRRREASDVETAVCRNRSARSHRWMIPTEALKAQLWSFQLSFLLLLPSVGCNPAPTAVEAEQPAPAPEPAPTPAPTPAPAPSTPESDPPSQPSQEPVQQASPEEQLVDGTLLDWRNSDKDTRIRAADYYNRVFATLRGNGRELSKIERATGAVILDRCLMQLAQDPAVRNRKVQDMAAVCLVALESQ